MPLSQFSLIADFHICLILSPSPNLFPLFLFSYSHIYTLLHSRKLSTALSIPIHMLMLQIPFWVTYARTTFLIPNNPHNFLLPLPPDISSIDLRALSLGHHYILFIHSLVASLTWPIIDFLLGWIFTTSFTHPLKPIPILIIDSVHQSLDDHTCHDILLIFHF